MPIPTLIVKSIENNTLYNVQGLHLHFLLFLFLAEVILASFTSSTVSSHSSTILSTIFFLHLQFSWYKYSLTSHALSHSHSQLPAFQINPLSNTPLSINYLHSHLHLSSFQRCSLLQKLASNLHLHLHVSYHSICLVSLVFDIRLNSLMFKFFITSGAQIFAYRSLISLQLSLQLLVLMLKGKNTGSLLLTLTIFGLYLHY